MPREPTSLLGASRLRVGEDRLTDLVAVAAQRSLPFARRLLVRARIDQALAQRVTRLRALTQTWTPRGRRPDLELIGYDGDALICRVWCENKLEALYQPSQLDDYHEDLATLPGQQAGLLTIVTRIEQVPRGAWNAATWGDIAADAVAVLRGRLGMQWRTAAWLPDTSAELLVLAELLQYLDQEHHVVSDPLTSTDVLVYAHAARAGNTLEALLDRAAQLCGESFSGGVTWSYTDTSMWTTFNAGEGDWWTRYSGYAEMHVADSDANFGLQRRGEPAVGVGVTLPGGYGETIFADQKEWVANLRHRGIDPATDTDADVLRLYRAIYLAEILIAGVTLEEQAGWLAERMREALVELRATPPTSELSLPPKRRSRRREQDSGLAQPIDGEAS